MDFSAEGALEPAGGAAQPRRDLRPRRQRALPSSLLHAAIPARVAGVSEIVVCSPPQRATGEIAEVVLAAAHVEVLN